MADETILLTQDGCHGCAAVKKALANALASGEVREVPITSVEGGKIADELHLELVPECISKDASGKYTKCSLKDLLDKKGK